MNDLIRHLINGVLILGFGTAMANSPSPSTLVPPIGGMEAGTTVNPKTTQATQYQNTVSPPPINLMSGVQANLNPKEVRGLMLANQWKQANEMPVRGEDGSVVFVYGATLPSIVCAPLYVCMIRLQPGETVTNIDIGDRVRWAVTPSTYGTGSRTTTVLVIKVKDSGLKTNMAIATDRRMYNIKLVSRMSDWMPMISFAYPEDIEAAWSAYYAKKTAQRTATILPSTGQNIANLDFRYRLSGDKPSWQPLRVYTDGKKTYIQFPPSIDSDTAPALVLIGKDKQSQLVNYRMVGKTYVVDLVIQQAALLSGVGKYQTKVVISRDGSVA